MHARIYPVYLLIAAAILIMLSAIGLFRDFTLGDILANLLLIQAWGLPVPTVIGASWSVSTEFAAYFAFPFLAALVLKGSALRLVAAFLLGACCILALGRRRLRIGRFQTVQGADRLSPRRRPVVRSRAARLFGWGVVYDSGMISYSLYLIHIPLNELFRHPLQALLVKMHVGKATGASGLILLLPLTLLAIASYHWVEKPARNAARRLNFVRRAPA